MNQKTLPLNYLLDQIAGYIKSENAVASESDKTRAKGITQLFHRLYTKDMVDFIKCSICKEPIFKTTYKHHYEICKENFQKTIAKNQEPV